MTEFFEAFNPAARHLREQKDLEKVMVARAKQGGKGPQPLDLDSGRIVLVRPGQQAPRGDVAVVRRATGRDLQRAGAVAVRAYLDASDLPHTDPYFDVLRNAAARDEAGEVWVAVLANKVVGTVTWCPPGSSLHEIGRDDEAEFRVLAVDPAAQGSGVGRLLVEAVLLRAREEGMAAVVLSSASWMTAAHALYRSVGFRRTPERDWSPRDDLGLVTFRLELDEGPA